MKKTSADYVYYAMVAEDDGTLRFPSGMSAMDCYSTPEEAEAAAKALGYNDVEIVQWDVN